MFYSSLFSMIQVDLPNCGEIILIFRKKVNRNSISHRCHRNRGDQGCLPLSSPAKGRVGQKEIPPLGLCGLREKQALFDFC